MTRAITTGSRARSRHASATDLAAKVVVAHGGRGGVVEASETDADRQRARDEWDESAHHERLTVPEEDLRRLKVGLERDGRPLTDAEDGARCSSRLRAAVAASASVLRRVVVADGEHAAVRAEAS